MPELDRYHARIDAGLCAACGQEPVEPGYTRCADCRMIAAEREARRRADRVAGGVCRTCGVHRPRPGSPDCPDCLARYAAYRRARNVGWATLRFCPTY